ncbi:hypothetical protein GWK47_036677 [Chionoecetes opilio]|uniref:Uncharacterized protein n=1 Tax=Chionoecetes opilio TaxID=41210 RepID=A0A8J4YE37_CHIOP|nr:hypothetical protein GWK47_036677 [Chionoecetes opilio]
MRTHSDEMFSNAKSPSSTLSKMFARGDPWQWSCRPRASPVHHGRTVRRRSMCRLHSEVGAESSASEFATSVFPVSPGSICHVSGRHGVHATGKKVLLQPAKQPPCAVGREEVQWEVQEAARSECPLNEQQQDVMFECLNKPQPFMTQNIPDRSQESDDDMQESDVRRQSNTRILDIVKNMAPPHGPQRPGLDGLHMASYADERGVKDLRQQSLPCQAVSDMGSSEGEARCPSRQPRLSSSGSQPGTFWVPGDVLPGGQ